MREIGILYIEVTLDIIEEHSISLIVVLQETIRIHYQFDYKVWFLTILQMLSQNTYEM